ncbi:MAG: efflux RND transporter periplasmic adaptor subunit [Acetobacteraceae bacterium]|nr:efflux RND transporter periplasmic adaptor subunit [Acetobacteraceae bacterium]
MAFLLCVLLVVGIGGAIWFWPDFTQPERARRARPDTTPVLVAPVQTQDVPIWLDALGTVQALNTVTIKPMVDGPLLEVRFREGQDVAVGDILARIDPRPYQAALDQAEARKAQDEAQLANARNDLGRYVKLAQSNFASAQQADTARAQVAQLEAQTRQDQAQIDSARTQLSYTTITAPIDGRAGMRQLDAGNIVHPGDAAGLLVITTLWPISVIFTLPQQSLPAVAAAMRAGAAEVLAIAQSADGVGAGQILDRGVLVVLDNQVDPTTGTIKLKAQFPNSQLLLWPGGFVGVRLRVDTQSNSLTVPPAAVQRGPRGNYVYVLRAEGSVERRAVQVGYEDIGLSVIVDGVRNQERVVTEGTARLSDGAKVNVVEPEPPIRGPTPAAPPGTRRRSGGTGSGG